MGEKVRVSGSVRQICGEKRWYRGSFTFMRSRSRDVGGGMVSQSSVNVLLCIFHGRETPLNRHSR